MYKLLISCAIKNFLLVHQARDLVFRHSVSFRHGENEAQATWLFRIHSGNSCAGAQLSDEGLADGIFFGDCEADRGVEREVDREGTVDGG